MDKVHEREGLWQQRKHDLEWWTRPNGSMENTARGIEGRGGSHDTKKMERKHSEAQREGAGVEARDRRPDTAVIRVFENDTATSEVKQRNM